MIENRRYPRYRVADFGSLVGRIADVYTPLRLVSISEGGCLFVSDIMDLDLAPPRKVRCYFQRVEGTEASAEMIRADGNVIYVRPLGLGVGVQLQYGIQFSSVTHSDEWRDLFVALEQEQQALGI